MAACFTISSSIVSNMIGCISGISPSSWTSSTASLESGCFWLHLKARFHLTYCYLGALKLNWHCLYTSINLWLRNIDYRPFYCVKWTLYFVSTSNIMEEFQFSRSFDLRNLCNMSVELCVFMKVWPWKNPHITCWRVRILQPWTKP